MPKYAALIYNEEINSEPDPDIMASVMADYGAFAAVAGERILAGEALTESDTATTVSVAGKGGDITTTDGPFAETKEVLGGFYILECGDLDEAVSLAALIPGAWSGKVEVRPVWEIPEG